MEYRKIISFGKSSYVISLPKGWVRQHRLKKGDLVYVDETGNSLVLQPRQSEDAQQEKEVAISVNGKPINHIQRELVAAYIDNAKTIVLSGSEIAQKASQIEPIIQNLIALEIMEQSSSRIMAKDFLNMEEISTANLIRKMDMIVKSMMQDSLTVFEQDVYENVNHRDRDVNRLMYLIFRAVRYGMEHQASVMKKFKTDANGLLQTYLVAQYIESIGDEVRRVARYMRQVRLSKSKQEQFLTLLGEVKDNYFNTVKAYYTNDVVLAHTISDRKKYIIEQCDAFYLDNRNVMYIAYMVDRLKRMISTVHKLGRIVCQ